jgi:hypothetical protein
MIVIQQDVWRADCIAGIGWDEEATVQVYPLHCAEAVEYYWNTEAEAARAYKAILEAWQKALGATP